MVLPSSESLPLRRTIATSLLPAAPIAFFTPSESIIDALSTKTTSAIPPALAIVVLRRSLRLRMLYAIGIISTHLSERFDDVEPRCSARGKERRDRPEGEREAEGHRGHLRRDAEVREVLPHVLFDEAARDLVDEQDGDRETDRSAERADNETLAEHGDREVLRQKSHRPHHRVVVRAIADAHRDRVSDEERHDPEDGERHEIERRQ